MNNDDLERFAEQVAAQYEQSSDRFEVEAYINSVVSGVITNARATLIIGTQGLPEPTHTKLELWGVQNRARVSLQIGEVVRRMLQKELLREK